MTEKMVTAKIKCPRCGTIEEFQVSRRALDARSRGALRDEAHAELTQERREQLTDHICTMCRRNQG